MTIESDVRSMLHRTTELVERGAGGEAQPTRGAGEPADAATQPAPYLSPVRTTARTRAARRQRLPVAVAAGVLVLVGIAALVTVTPGTGNVADRPPETAAPGPQVRDEHSWVDVFAHVPDVAGITAVDYARAREIAGLADDATDDEVAAAYMRLADDGALDTWEAEGIVSSHGVAAVRRLYGVAAGDVDVVVEVLDDAADPTTVVHGRFDRTAVDRAVRRPDNPVDHRTGEYRGVPYHSWGEGQTEFVSMNSRLAVSDRFLVFSMLTEPMHAAVVAILDGTPGPGTLDPIAEAADDLGLVQLTALREPPTSEPDADDPAGDPLDRPVVDGRGSGADDGGAFRTALFLYADEVTAADNLDRVETRLERLGADGGVTATVEGPLLIVRAPADATARELLAATTRY